MLAGLHLLNVQVSSKTLVGSFVSSSEAWGGCRRNYIPPGVPGSSPGRASIRTVAQWLERRNCFFNDCLRRFAAGSSL